MAFHWVGSLWEYDAQHDSLITAGNGGTKPVQAALTINYNQGTQKYELEQALQPDEQMWIDVGKLIREHVPDKNGNVLPADLASGSYEIRDMTDKFIGNLFEGKIVYDKTYGHVTYGCGGCCGYTQTKLWYDPLTILLLSTTGTGVSGYTTCGPYWEDVSGAFYGFWTTANGSIATVDYYANHKGVGIGSTTSSTVGYLEHSTQKGQTCPVLRFPNSGGDNVQRPTYFFSPSAVHVATPPVCVQEGATGYFLDVSYYVADSTSVRVSQSGMAPGENLGDGTGWHDAFATPPTTRSDGSFDDTPNGSCYVTPVHHCETISPQSFRLTSGGTVFPIATNTTRRTCTDGISIVLQGNPAAQNKTYTFGNVQ